MFQERFSGDIEIRLRDGGKGRDELGQDQGGVAGNSKTRVAQHERVTNALRHMQSLLGYRHVVSLSRSTMTTCDAETQNISLEWVEGLKHK